MRTGAVGALIVVLVVAAARDANASCVCESWNEDELFCDSTDTDGTPCCEVCGGAGDTATCEVCDVIAKDEEMEASHGEEERGGCRATGSTGPGGILGLLVLLAVKAGRRRRTLSSRATMTDPFLVINS